jgi:hypothetical protein
MKDVYNKPDKAGTRQQINSRLARLGDELRRVRREERSILEDIVELQNSLLENDL